MAVIRPRDLLSDGLLERLSGAGVQEWAASDVRHSRLGGPAFAGGPVMAGGAIVTGGPAVAGGITRRAGSNDVARALTRDIAKLRDVGYLNVALPGEFGGLGCTLRQAACGQRRLARRAPLTALAVSAHLYWTGAAADAYRAGDMSARWMLVEAARGALFAAGHGTPGNDLLFASPDSLCEQAGESGYRFRSPGVLSALTPAWDWVAVHAITSSARPDAVLAFAGRGSRCTPAFRVAGVMPAGPPADVFTTSAIGWGFSILASVQYSAARGAFNRAIAVAARRPARPGPGPGGDYGGRFRGPDRNGAPGGVLDEPGGGHPLDQWPVAEASLRLDGMKARIAEITHPWPARPRPDADPGGQHLIRVFTMRHEVADGARRVLDLTSQIAEPALAPA